MNLTAQQRAILQAVSEIEPEAYGVPIRRRASELLGHEEPKTIWGLILDPGVIVGAMYADLERMEESGLVESYTDGILRPERGNRSRTYFRLTGTGHWALTPTETREPMPVALRGVPVLTCSSV